MPVLPNVAPSAPRAACSALAATVLAFRAGAVDGAQWSDANVGLYSAVFGVRTTASGFASLAAGDGAAATGANAIALGSGAAAGGGNSIALGTGASTAGRTGAVVIADASPGTAAAAANNEFLVRAAGGVRLRTSGDLSKGCNVDGQGNLTCTGAISLAGSVTRLAFEWVNVPGASSRTVTVVCPTGTLVIGGGVDTRSGGDGGGDFKVRETYPSTSQNAWIGTVRNDDIFSGEFRVHAICLRA